MQVMMLIYKVLAAGTRGGTHYGTLLHRDLFTDLDAIN